MSKTPEKMAEEYVAHNRSYPYDSLNAQDRYMRNSYLVGYQAAQHKDKAVNRTHLAWKLAEDYGAVKWLKHKDPKRFGSTERDYEYTIARDGFYQGYQAAKDQVADADKVMNSSNNLNGWISIHDELPKTYDDVLWCNPSSKIMTISAGNPKFDGDLNDQYFTYWMPLPEPPKGEE